MGYKQKIYLFLIILVVIVIALSLFLINPLEKKVKALSNELKQKNSLIASYKEKGGAYLKSLREEYADLEAEISRINGSFIDSEKAIDFILVVEQIAALTSNYQEIKEVKSSEEKVLSFQVSLWGSFSDLVKFLTRLENIEYFVDFDSLQITKIGERDLKTLSDKGIVVSVGDVKSVIDIRAYEGY